MTKMSDFVVTLDNLDEALVMLRKVLDETPKDTKKYNHYKKLEELYLKILNLEERITNLELRTKND